MKRLFLGIVIATLAYSGWWFYAAHDLRSSVETWFEDLRAAGWDATYADITVRGFPSRTDLTLTEPTLMSPNGKIGWQAPFFQILGLTYKKGHVIAAWPDAQTLQTPDGAIAVTSEGMRASVIYEDDRVLRSNFEAAVVNLAGPDETVALAGVNAALEQTVPGLAEYRVAVAINGLAMSNPSVTGSLAPEALATLRAETVIRLSDPLSLTSPTDSPPQLEALTVRTMQVDYGALTMKLGGHADFDEQGRATGEVTLEAQNWREALQTAQDAGNLPPEIADTVRDVLGLVASLNGNRDTLDITFGLDRGRVMLGPLPIGELQPFVWP